jgi:hypothetical protein
MASEMLWGGILLAYLTGAILLFLQVRTYKRTRHRSLLVAAASQIFGIAYVSIQISSYLLADSTSTRWTLFYLANACLYLQCVIGVFGAVMIFRAFEEALSQRRPAQPPA